MRTFELNYLLPLKKVVTKISFLIVIGIFISACNAVKRVPNSKQLLVSNKIIIDGKNNKNDIVETLLSQKPNSQILGFKFRLNLYNLAKLNPDSIYKAKFIASPDKLKRQSWLLSEKQVKRKGKSFFYFGIHNFLKSTGEAPVILDNFKTEKSVLRLKTFYFQKGYFNNIVDAKTDSVGTKRASVRYIVSLGNASAIDSIRTNIESPALDSLYKINQSQSIIKSGKIYNSSDFDNEKNRITTHFRNSGAYDFQSSNVLFVMDTVGTKGKVNVLLQIKNQVLRSGDSSITRPFHLYKISRVNIYTDLPTPENKTIADSITYKNFHLYGYQKIKYRPKAITDAVFINQGGYFSDVKENLSRRYLTNLRIFNFPSINYFDDLNVENGHAKVARIILKPLPKFRFTWNTDVLHSNIQQFGLAGGLSIAVRNVFNRAETFEITARANPGFSRDLANPKNNFFNILEYGIDLKLNFPRILFPFETEKIISKAMIPSTVLNLGFAKQENIGLDRENFIGSMYYSWTPKQKNTARFDLFNIQYVNNINTANYFNVYNSSYEALNELAKIYNTKPEYFDNNVARNLTIAENGADGFINDVLNGTIPTSTEAFKSIRSIEERRRRLTENNLIFATSFQFTKTTSDGRGDANFYTIKSKIEAAGNVLSLFTAASKEIDNSINKKKIFGIEFSQYIKGEIEYIKHWDLKNDKVFATRTFVGLAVPYGNSDNIPFVRSYFAGGPNDIRAWQPYSLGPGGSGAINDFNEANLKITTSAEFRFKIVNDLKGALFIDAGNIWNVFDNVTDKPSIFENLNSLKNIAVGSGIGLRYDLNFFVFRADLGYKTYNPSNIVNDRWFSDFSFSKTVLNIGINYPF